MHLSVVVFVLLTVLALAPGQAQTPAPSAKKLIYYGWGSPRHNMYGTTGARWRKYRLMVLAWWWPSIARPAAGQT